MLSLEGSGPDAAQKAEMRHFQIQLPLIENDMAENFHIYLEESIPVTPYNCNVSFPGFRIRDRCVLLDTHTP